MDWLRSFFGYFLSPLGLGVLAALDSSLVFFVPFGVDAVVILLAARDSDRFWMYPLLATAGSLGGAAVTFYVGRRLGEPGLKRMIRPDRLERIQNRAATHVAVWSALLGLIPPPFPFKFFILACGALDASKTHFFVGLAAARLARFSVDAWLAQRFGERITAWFESDTFQWVVGGFIFIVVVGSVVSAVKLYKSTR
jgi:membrane protein YqaA with SNARE-associated domain